MPFYKAEDFETIFDPEDGFGTNGYLEPIGDGDTYRLPAIYEENVDFVDEYGNHRIVQRTITVLRKDTRDERLETGDMWTRIADGVVYLVQNIVDTDEFVDQYEVIQQ